MINPIPLPFIKQGYDGSPEMDRMFKARARQFHDRLGWDVSVDDQGREMDQYDNKEATYLIITDLREQHLASCRMIPIVRPTMTREAFPGLFDLSMIDDPDTCLECTRFCVTGTPDHSETYMTKRLFREGARWLEKTSCSSLIAVFYPAMLRVYRRAGWSPSILNRKDGLIVGQWLLPNYLG